MLYPNSGSWFYDFVTLSQFCRINSVVAKISQLMNRRHADLNQSRRSVTELVVHGAACQSSASTVANGYQCKQ